MKTSKLLFCTMLIVLSCGLLKAQGDCSNLDFSSANFTNWQAYQGKCMTWNSVTRSFVSIPSPVTVPTSNRIQILNRVTLVSQNKLYDEICPAITKVPDGFTYSCKLGNSNRAGDIDAMEYTITVDSNNSLLILHFAWVMENPGHALSDQPQFSMRLKDTNGNVLQIPCADVSFVAQNGMSNLACQTSSRVARNWTTVGFSLESMIGQTIKIYFEVRDCTLYGHYGYAYMVGECRPMKIVAQYCERQTGATFTAPDGFVSYIWSRSSDTSWSSIGKNISINNPIDGEYIYCDVTSDLGCTSSLYVVLNKTIIQEGFVINNPQKLNAATPAYDTCARTALFVDTSTANNGTITQTSWQIPALNVSDTGNSFLYTFPPSQSDSTVYDIVSIVTTADGCSDTTIKPITIYKQPTANIIAFDSVCVHANANLYVELEPAGVHQSLWSYSPSQQTFQGDTISFIGQGTYSVTVTDKHGCVSTQSKYISAYVPQIDYTLHDALCFNSSSAKIEQHQMVGFFPPIVNSYIKNSQNVIVVDSLSYTASQYENLFADTYYIYAIDSRGCEFFDTISLQQPTVGTNLITTTASMFCSGDSSLLSASHMRSDYSYSWSKEGQVLGTLSSQTVFSSGLYVLTTQDSNGCLTVDSTTVFVSDPQFSVECSVVPITCHGLTNGKIYAGDVVGLMGPFTYNLLSLDSDVVSDFDSVQKVWENLPSGNYKVLVEDQLACIVSQTLEVVDPSPLTVNTLVVEPYCGMRKGKITAKAQGGVGGYSYLWMSDKTVLSTDSLIEDLSKGLYSLTVEDSNDCSILKNVNLQELNRPQLFIDSISPQTCGYRNGFIGISVELQHDESYEIIWEDNVAPKNSFIAAELEQGSYRVTLVDRLGCSTEKTVSLDAFVAPTIILDSLVHEKCDQENGKIIITVQADTVYDVIWKNSTCKSEKMLNIGAGSYTAIASTLYCSDTTTYIVKNTPGPKAAFETINDTMDLNERLYFYDHSSGVDLKMWNWNFGDGHSGSGRFTTHSYSEEGFYTVELVVTDANNCSDTAENLINIIEPLTVFVPNAFTPNGDNVNDLWFPVISGYHGNGYKLSLYDRWGNLIFLTEDETFQWDGYSNSGEFLQANVAYAYFLVIKDVYEEEHVYKGFVTIVR